MDLDLKLAAGRVQHVPESHIGDAIDQEAELHQWRGSRH